MFGNRRKFRPRDGDQRHPFVHVTEMIGNHREFRPLSVRSSTRRRRIVRRPASDSAEPNPLGTRARGTGRGEVQPLPVRLGVVDPGMRARSPGRGDVLGAARPGRMRASRPQRDESVCLSDTARHRRRVRGARMSRPLSRKPPSFPRSSRGQAPQKRESTPATRLPPLFPGRSEGGLHAGENPFRRLAPCRHSRESGNPFVPGRRVPKTRTGGPPCPCLAAGLSGGGPPVHTLGRDARVLPGRAAPRTCCSQGAHVLPRRAAPGKRAAPSRSLPPDPRALFVTY